MDKKTAKELENDRLIKRAVQKTKIKKILMTGRGREFVEELIITVANSSLTETKKVGTVNTLSSKIGKYRYSAEPNGTEYLAGYLANMVVTLKAYVLVDNIYAKINEIGGE